MAFGDIDVNKTLINIWGVSCRKKEKKKRKENNFKYFIGYKNDEKVKPLCISIPQMKEYVQCFKKQMNM